MKILPVRFVPRSVSVRREHGWRPYASSWQRKKQKQLTSAHFPIAERLVVPRLCPSPRRVPILRSLKSLRLCAKANHYHCERQKTWTRLPYANIDFLPVRHQYRGESTEAFPSCYRHGNTAGITVICGPIITLDGEHEVNESSSFKTSKCQLKIG